MLLVIDIGNTNITIGAYLKDTLLDHFAVKTDTRTTADEFGILLLSLLERSKVTASSIESAVISSVVPQMTGAVGRAIKKYLNTEPLILTIDMIKNFKVCCDNPQSLGMDRAVNVAAACELYGAPLIVVDFGTATTFCAVVEGPKFIGGAIFPGMSTLVDALASKAAKLPAVEIKKPKKVIGTDTITNIQSGIFYGYVELVDGMLRRTKDEMNSDRVKVIASGGLADLIADECKQIDIVNKFLTLEGLRIVFEYNTKKVEEK